MTLRELILEIAKEWPNYRRARVVDGGHRAYDLVVNQYPEELRRLVGNPPGLMFMGSTGRGNVTAAPWIATFDWGVTTTAQSGYYPVYLFSTDLSRVYLSFGIGVTQFEDRILYPSAAEGRAALLKVTAQVRALLDDLAPSRISSGDLNLGDVPVGKLHDSYSRGSCFNYRYELSGLPASDDLERDYREMVEFYRRATHHPALESIDNFAEIHVKEPKHEDILVEISMFEPPPGRGKRGPGRGKPGAGGGGRRGSPESKKVGDAGEAFVLKQERLRLVAAGRRDLAERIIPHCQGKKDFPGWDITSYEEDGTPIYIEVKSKKGSTISSIELTDNEYEAAKRESDKYRLYLVTRALTAPSIQLIVNPVAKMAEWGLEIKPSSYRLKFVADD